MNMKKTKVIKLNAPCKRCGSYSYIIFPKGPHIGLYCNCCTTWIKWLSKSEQDEYGVSSWKENDAKAKMDDVDEVVRNIMDSVDDEEVPWF